MSAWSRRGSDSDHWMSAWSHEYACVCNIQGRGSDSSNVIFQIS